MLFKRRFFLDLSGGEEPKQEATVAPTRPQPAVAKKPAAKQPPKQEKAAVSPAAATAVEAPAEAPQAPSAAPAATGRVLTTAEAIAAELAAEEANRPAPRQATFAPECLVPGAALQSRRRGGANLALFRDMAKGMMGS